MRRAWCWPPCAVMPVRPYVLSGALSLVASPWWPARVWPARGVRPSLWFRLLVAARCGLPVRPSPWPPLLVAALWSAARSCGQVLPATDGVPLAYTTCVPDPSGVQLAACMPHPSFSSGSVAAVATDPLVMGDLLVAPGGPSSFFRHLLLASLSSCLGEASGSRACLIDISQSNFMWYRS